MNKVIPAEIIKHKSDQIVDKHYEKVKVKPTFTKMADNARDLLEYKYNSTTGKFTNSDGVEVERNEAVKFNNAINKNFQDHKQDDYIAQLKHFGNINSQKKVSGYPRAAPKTKLTNMPLINRNINNLKTTPTKTNPTIERYKQFKEEKKFNENFEKEYSDKAMEKYVRSKVYENKKAGKADYEDLPSSYLIVGEAAKDRAKKELAAIKTSSKITTEPDYFDYETEVNNIKNEVSSLPTLDQWMKTRVPIEQDPPGITGLDKVKNFKRSAYLTDQKFPKVAKGIGPFLTGEDD
tara:strand:- start:994 stop:1869 length:876 start_codon:yes stop_codon:yes gene_type:complete